MSQITLSSGNILKNTSTGIRFRVIAMPGKDVVLCTMGTSKFELTALPRSLVVSMINNAEFIKEKDDAVIFDVEALEPIVREKYETKLSMVREVEEAYSPDFLTLCGKNPKPEVKAIVQKYNIPLNTFWRIIRRYFQSGRREYSLLDGRILSTNKGMHYNYSKKPGRPPALVPESGVIRDERTLEIFEEMKKEYLSGRNTTYHNVYDLMINLYYSHIEVIDGVEQIVYDPISKRPTYDQLKNYIRTNTDKKQRLTAKTSEREFNNDARPLTGSSNGDAWAPGDLVEIDECEDDVSLVALNDKDRTVGRPTVYFMVDVYSYVIVAVSVDFQVNSNIGLTNLFLNLGDNKQEFCRKYGFNFTNPDLWPSNFIPARIRLDRGAEMKSKMIEDLCVKAGINRQLVPGASGSLKGVVEQSFHQLHSTIKIHLENCGLIEKRYDSNHHREATLDIEEYTRIVIAFVLYHNQRYMKNYRLTLKMLQDNVKPIPAELWRYGCEKFTAPMPIRVPEQYLFNLMTPVTAKVTRRGIRYEGLYYITDSDPVLADTILKVGTKTENIAIHIDMRCIGAVYYLRDGRLITVPLNKSLNNQDGLELLTMAQWKALRKQKAVMDKNGESYNQDLSAYNYTLNASIVEDAKKDTYSSAKNIRPARAAEKERISASSTIAARLEDQSETIEEPEPAATGAIISDDEYEMFTSIFDEIFGNNEERSV